MWQSLPEFGTGVLYAILVAAAYTFAVSLGAGRGRPRLLQAARLGAYGTVSLVGLAVLVLAYAFQSHDFRISYVAHYSDRGMSVPFLFAALWGGQDGSILWWLFLTALFTGICVAWLRRRYLELQPYVIATLMGVISFFAVLMIFATNPFATSIAGTPADGNGLNNQLRDIYMIIHPPSLYTGFTSAAVPFAFAIAALATGRLDSEWIVATRKWMLFSFLFLSIGNALGMVWAYKELGWGGPWAWDPVENAAFLPWLTASAYVHSIMIQERRGMMKVWNVVLICLTFFLTIFGTFLTRSGLIASVHSFAQSGIGIYFVYFMGIIIATCTALIVYRLPQLRSEGELESVLSREAAFLGNNWGFLSLMVFIVTATTWPRISEWLLDKKSTLGPPFYNMWIPPIAFVLFALMGVAPLLGWRKTSPELFYKGFRWPTATMVVAGIAHIVFGRRLGFPAFINVDPIYSTVPNSMIERLFGFSFGSVLAKAAGVYPFIAILIVAFNLAVVVQEFVRGVAARRKNSDESAPVALFNLVAKSRRRYGGYLVHVGIAIMLIGFVGRGWSLDKEATLAKGDTVQFEEYTVTYAGPRMEVDQEKRMIFADLDVTRDGKPVGRISPAQFIYKSGGSMGGGPRTVVARYPTLRDELYVIIGMVNPQTKVAAFQMHVNTLIWFIWIGVMVLGLGSVIAMWPEIALEEASAWSYVRGAASIGTAVMFGVLLAAGTGQAYAAMPPPKPIPTIDNPKPPPPTMPRPGLEDHRGPCPDSP
jgi:cytochrome c-type biogenesis protein CcmF